MSGLLRFLVFCSVILYANPVTPQSCCGNHLSEQFSNHYIVDTMYATNRVLFNGLSTNLSLRIWNAQNNPCTKKPLIVFLHGGGFIQGDNQLMDSLCRAFSSRGFLAASVQYRLGWFGDQYCSADSAEAIRAWYRAVADCREATFFLKNEHAWLGIDTNLVFLSGWSAGGYIAAGAAFLDHPHEKPSQCDSLPPLEWPPGNLQLRPDIGGMPEPLRSLDIKGIITFSSSMLFPSLLVDQLLPIPVLAFNNQQDPYEVPIDQLAPWWSINACAAFYPHAAGWSSPEVSSLMNSGSMQHVIYNEAACAHNLHHPCFPFWQEEIETMSQFMQDKMDCTFPLSQTKITLNESNQVIVCHSLSQLQEILNKHKQARFVSLTGQELKPETLFDSEGGIYYLITPDSTIRIAVVQ